MKHYFWFLEVESLALKGKEAEAVNLFKRAIKMSTRGGFQQDVALANERLGDLYLKWQNPDKAIYHLKEAIKFWKSWGAQGKVDSLARKHSVVFARTIHTAEVPSNTV